LSTKRDSVRLYKIRKLISELSSKEGRGTELISLYVPPKKPVHEVISNLRDEWGTAGNIKSDTTRNHVQDALVKTMQRLKLYKTTPENGLVIFCGALPTNGPGSEVVTIHEIVPPKPVSTYLYMCLSPGTRILLRDGTEKTMEELKSCWVDESVVSYDKEKGKFVSGPIRRYLDIPVGERKTYRLTAESGREIIATEDHPFCTPRGWVRLGQLRRGDLVCVLPLPGLAREKVNNRAFKYSSKKMLKAALRGEYLRIKSVLREEAKKGLTRAREMQSSGTKEKEISDFLPLLQGTTAGQSFQGLVKAPLVSIAKLPRFDQWLKIANGGLAEPLLWESVISIERVEIPEVRDG